MMSKRNNVATALLVGVGSLFGLWALAAVVGGLHRVGWNVTEFVRSGLVASGMIQPIHTMVDFYIHIKGIEYIICVIFFILFPVFYALVEHSGNRVTTTLPLRRETKSRQDQEH